jgi:hypothetical protein
MLQHGIGVRCVYGAGGEHPRLVPSRNRSQPRPRTRIRVGSLQGVAYVVQKLDSGQFWDYPQQVASAYALWAILARNRLRYD